MKGTAIHRRTKAINRRNYGKKTKGFASATLHQHLFLSFPGSVFLQNTVGKKESGEVELQGEVNRIALHRVVIRMLMSLF